MAWGIEAGVKALRANGFAGPSLLAKVRPEIEHPRVYRWVKYAAPEIASQLPDVEAERAAARAEAERLAKQKAEEEAKKRAEEQAAALRLEESLSRTRASALAQEKTTREKRLKQRRQVARRRSEELARRYPDLEYLAELNDMDDQLDRLERTDKEYFDCLHSYIDLLRRAARQR